MTHCKDCLHMKGICGEFRCTKGHLISSKGFPRRFHKHKTMKYMQTDLLYWINQEGCPDFDSMDMNLYNLDPCVPCEFCGLIKCPVGVTI